MKISNPLLIILIISASVVFAADVPFTFPDEAMEIRYRDLTEELRCLVCQNQSLADSNAELAQDLRDEVYQMLIDGKSNKQIIDYLVTRYGDFVLYRPPFKITTLLLWLGPVIFLAAAIFLIISIFRRQKPRSLSQEDQERVKQLLGEESSRE